MQLFEDDIIQSLSVLKQGGLLLYPTDTVWGIGCDATNEKAVERVFRLKQRDDSKSLIVLLASAKDIQNFVAAPDPGVYDYIEKQSRPTTIVFDGAIGFAENVIAADGSVAIRMVQDEFCRHLIKRFGKPIVSTSANISGSPTASHFDAIDAQIKKGVDYIVKWRQEEIGNAVPSKIVSWKGGVCRVIRE